MIWEVAVARACKIAPVNKVTGRYEPVPSIGEVAEAIQRAYQNGYGDGARAASTTAYPACGEHEAHVCRVKP